MAGPLFLGDEVSAAGWRLAGATVVTPTPGEEAARFQEALHRADLVLITAHLAARLPPTVLSRGLVSIDPPVLVVPDARGLAPAPDLGTAMQARLGMEP